MRNHYQSIQEFTQEVQRRERAKADYVVPTAVLTMEGNNVLSFGGNKLPMTEGLPHSQVAARLGIPKRYYDAIGEVPGLRAYNVNALLHHTEDRRMIRVLDGQVRAFVSDSFKPFDNWLALNAALPVLSEYADLQVVGNAITDQRMYLQAVFPRFEGEVRKGDVVRYGLTITNSEVGLGNINVETLLWRLACLNGAVAQSLLKKRHLGSRLESDEDGDYSIYQSDTLNAEMESLRLRLRDTIRAALTESAWQAQLARMQEAAGVEVKRPDYVIENVTRKYLLDEEERALMTKSFMEGKDFSRWGLANSVTALAHAVKEDRQYEVERAGADLLYLNGDQWELMNEKPPEKKKVAE